jgi:Mrp family chromosome partitioning ATPase
LRRIGVVAANRGEGTTTVALGLARGLARERDRRVLVLELELRRPGLDAALGLTAPSAGLCDYLEGRAETPLLRRHEGGFWVLSAGEPPSPPPDLGAARRLDVLLRAMDRVFDWIVVDCPPLSAAPDAAVLQDRLDGFVFNVRLRHSRRDAVRRAAAQLRPGKLVGVVLNAQRA